MKANQSNKKWDVFICHASEDKDSLVRPLAVSLNQLGAEVWFDEFSLRLGDSLSRSIDQGLANSRFGIVVVSPNFIGKAWPERELSGLVSREIDQGRVIIAIWHGVTPKQVLDFSPTLADKLAVRAENLTPQDVAIQVLREIRPDIYEKHPRSELERLVSGEAVNQLQQELERAKVEISGYKCRFCGALLVESRSEGVGPNSDHYVFHEIFECGYHAVDGYTERPCPSDPNFPHFEDYEPEFHLSPSETQDLWLCFARPMTDMARKFSLQPGYGRSKGDAVRRLREQYERRAIKHSE